MEVGVVYDGARSRGICTMLRWFSSLLMQGGYMRPHCFNLPSLRELEALVSLLVQFIGIYCSGSSYRCWRDHTRFCSYSRMLLIFLSHKISMDEFTMRGRAYESFRERHSSTGSVHLLEAIAITLSFFEWSNTCVFFWPS